MFSNFPELKLGFCLLTFLWFLLLLLVEMETEERNQRACNKATEPEFFLQWGNRKRLRCVRVKDPRISTRLNGGIRRKLTSAVDNNNRSGVTLSEKETSHIHHHQQPNRLTRLFTTTKNNGSSHVYLPLLLLMSCFLFFFVSLKKLGFWFLWCNDGVSPLLDWWILRNSFSRGAVKREKLHLFLFLVWFEVKEEMGLLFLLMLCNDAVSIWLVIEKFSQWNRRKKIPSFSVWFSEKIKEEIFGNLVMFKLEIFNTQII